MRALTPLAAGQHRAPNRFYAIDQDIIHITIWFARTCLRIEVVRTKYHRITLKRAYVRKLFHVCGKNNKIWAGAHSATYSVLREQIKA